VPVAVVGCEEAYPSILNLKGLARLVGCALPSGDSILPPSSVPSEPLPLPTRVRIQFGAPMMLQGEPDAPEAEVEAQASQVGHDPADAG
jgi:hypothetical protein